MHILIGAVSLLVLLFLLIRFPLTAVCAILFPFIGYGIVIASGGTDSTAGLIAVLGFFVGFLFGAALHQFSD